jgi:hypothetical protein
MSWFSSAGFASDYGILIASVCALVGLGAAALIFIFVIRGQSSRRKATHSAKCGATRTAAESAGTATGTQTAPKLALIKASWCQGCKLVSPLVAELRSEGVDILEIDGPTQGPQWLMSNKVAHYPTFCMVKLANETDTKTASVVSVFTGPMTKDNIKTFKTSYLPQQP